MPSPPHETAAPGSQLERLLALAVEPDPVRTAVVHPVDELSLSGAVEAAAAHLIVPVLVGPQARIRKAAEGAGLDISDFEVVDAPHSHAAAARACELARDGQVSAIMKGALHTDELLEAAVSAAWMRPCTWARAWARSAGARAAPSTEATSTLPTRTRATDPAGAAWFT